MGQNYQISEQFPSLKEEEALDFPIFARKEYLRLHTEEANLKPVMLLANNEDIIAFWCFNLDEKQLIAPVNAPYFTHFNASPEFHSEFINLIISFIKKKYELTVKITLDPDYKFSLIQNKLSSFRITNVAVGTTLLVNSDGLVGQIRSLRKKRKLNSLLSKDYLQVSQVAEQDWLSVYELNTRWRQSKEHQSFMGVKQMEKAKSTFSEHYHAFQIKEDDECIGTAFLLVINSRKVYVYSLITDPAKDLFEPALLLWDSIYKWAEKHGFKEIDMGTSMAYNQTINRNLLKYKQRIGGSIYRKYTFEC